MDGVERVTDMALPLTELRPEEVFPPDEVLAGLRLAQGD
jgi:hypothetical protein